MTDVYISNRTSVTSGYRLHIRIRYCIATWPWCRSSCRQNWAARHVNATHLFRLGSATNCSTLDPVKHAHMACVWSPWEIAGAALSGPSRQIMSNYRVRRRDAVTETLCLQILGWQMKRPITARCITL